jgi:hypothetical protein
MNQHKKNIIAYLSGHCLQIPVIASHALPCTVIASAAKQTQATGSQKTATRSPAFRHYEPCPPQSRHCEQRSVIASKAKQSLILIDNQIQSIRGAGTRHCERSEANPDHVEPKQTISNPASLYCEPCPPQSRHCEQRSVIASKAKQSLSLIDNQIKSTRGAGTRHCERSEANPGHRQSKQTIRNQASRHYKQSEAIPSHFAYTNTTPQNAPISTPGDHQ